MDLTKIVKADLNSPRRELFNGGLKSAITLLVRWHIFFVGSYWTSNPAVAVFRLCKFLLVRWRLRAESEWM